MSQTDTPKTIKIKVVIVHERKHYQEADEYKKYCDNQGIKGSKKKRIKFSLQNHRINPDKN